MRVAVIGAGIGGLTAAVGLQQAGAEVEVFERAGVLKPAGAGLSVFGNGLTALDAIGLGAGLRAQSAAAGPLRAGQRTPTGAWLTSTPPEAITELRIVHRADLQALLLDALAPETVTFGVAVVGVSEAGDEIEVERHGPADGPIRERRRYDLVVAADGIRSRVRASWPGDPGVRYAGYSAWRGVTHQPVDLAGAAGETWGRGLRFGIAPLVGGHVYWFAVASLPAGTVFDDEFAEVTRRFSGWHRPVAEIIRATPETAVFRHDIFDLAAPLPTFRRGRCLLLGDAAHAMTPDLGQGGNQAMEDGVTLARLVAPLARDDRPDPAALLWALDTYDVLRRRRTQAIARQARAVGRVAQTRGRGRVALRNAALRVLPASVAGHSLATIQSWQPPDAGALQAGSTLADRR